MLILPTASLIALNQVLSQWSIEMIPCLIKAFSKYAKQVRELGGDMSNISVTLVGRN